MRYFAPLDVVIQQGDIFSQNSEASSQRRGSMLLKKTFQQPSSPPHLSCLSVSEPSLCRTSVSLASTHRVGSGLSSEGILPAAMDFLAWLKYRGCWLADTWRSRLQPTSPLGSK